MKLYRALLWIQGIYSLITGIWPLVHIQSFMRITGPKTDIWLVKTVGVLITAIAVTLLSHLFSRTNPWQAAILASAAAFGLGMIDVYYTAKKIISPVYLGDAAIEFVLVVCWIVLMIQWKQQKTALKEFNIKN